MITGNGNYHRHHKYEVCPDCGQKGFYQPLSLLTEEGFIVPPKTCRLCGYVAGKITRKPLNHGGVQYLKG